MFSQGCCLQTVVIARFLSLSPSLPLSPQLMCLFSVVFGMD